MVKHIKTTNEFDSIIRENHIVIVDFFANWCSPCRMMGPVLDEVSAEHPEWTAVKVDCDYKNLLLDLVSAAFLTLKLLSMENLLEISSVPEKKKYLSRISKIY